MAASSQELMTQIQNYGDQPDFKSSLADLYKKPVLEPLTNEAANLESQYLTGIFDPFTKMGTGAADLSPAAKLSGIGASLGRIGGRVGANQSVQNYYGAQIQDLANTEAQKWQNRKSDLMNLYNMQFQKEQADRADQLARMQMAQAQQAAKFPDLPTAPKTREQQAQELISQGRALNPGSYSDPTNYARAQEMIREKLRQLGYDPAKLNIWGSSTAASIGVQTPVSFSNTTGLSFK